VEGWKDGMGRDGARPSQQMIRNDHWSFDQDLEGGPVPRRRACRCKLCFAATRHAPNVGALLVARLQGTAALQGHSQSVFGSDPFQGGMASVPSQFSPYYKG